MITLFGYPHDSANLRMDPYGVWMSTAYSSWDPLQRRAAWSGRDHVGQTDTNNFYPQNSHIYHHAEFCYTHFCCCLNMLKSCSIHLNPPFSRAVLLVRSAWNDGAIILASTQTRGSHNIIRRYPVNTDSSPETSWLSIGRSTDLLKIWNLVKHQWIISEFSDFLLFGYENY